MSLSCTSWFQAGFAVAASTATFTLDPCAGTAEVAPGCVTVNVCSATVRVPMRGLALGLGAAVKLTDSFPIPVVGEVTVSHDALLVAVQGHAAALAVITAVPSPPNRFHGCCCGLQGEVAAPRPLHHRVSQSCDGQGSHPAWSKVGISAERNVTVAGSRQAGGNGDPGNIASGCPTRG